MSVQWCSRDGRTSCTANVLRLKHESALDGALESVRGVCACVRVCRPPSAASSARVVIPASTLLAFPSREGWGSWGAGGGTREEGLG